MQIASEDSASAEVPATDMIDAGLFTWDIPDNTLYADGAIAELFGLDPKQAALGLPLERYLERIHPDDRPRIVRAIRNSILAASSKHEAYSVCGADGTYVDVECFTRGFCDKDGMPIRYAGIVVPASDVNPGFVFGR
ncbi:PAS domain-containing protein [Rhizobium sp.]